MTSLSQHPLLACSRDVRIECLEEFYRHNRFHASFDLSVNKLEMSELATTIELLPTHLRALLARNSPTLPVFEEAPKINKPKLRIFFRGFKHMTLATFVHWTSLFHCGHLALHTFEFLQTHPVGWSLAQAVYKWVNDFVSSEEELEDMTASGAAMQRSKARLIMIDGGRIARIGLKVMQTVVIEISEEWLTTNSISQTPMKPASRHLCPSLVS